jgi:DNA-binding transcriptional LysR family regulator
MLTSDDLRFFHALAASRSLAAAARLLNVSPPAVTQRLRALEARLKMQLIHRGRRFLTLTDEGELLARHGGDIISSLAELDSALAERRGEIVGQMRILAPLGFGRRYIAPLVADFQARNPRLQMELTLTDRPDRAAASAWDLAIHVGGLSDATPSLSMRRIAPNERFLCASPAYLARHEPPRQPKDLSAHACIALRENDEDVTLWRFRKMKSATEEKVRIDPCLSSNDGEIVKAWALAGCGLIVRSEWDVSADLRTGRLIRVLPGYRLPSAPIVALIGTRREARAARVGRFLQELTRHFLRPEWRS